MHYVCADIHGQYELFKKLLKELNLQLSDRLYVLGDAIDRGPDSFGVLGEIMGRENIEMFIGNHEAMMFDYLYKTANQGDWFYGNNGGYKTYQDFIKLPKKSQEEIIEYLKQAWIQKYIEVEGHKYALHHSYYLEDKIGQDVRYCEEPDSDAVFKAVWYSPYRLWEHVNPSSYDDGYTHIIGHVPVQNLQKAMPPHYDKKLKKKLINIDGGCAIIPRKKIGGLFCMSLEMDNKGERKEFWITP